MANRLSDLLSNILAVPKVMNPVNAGFASLKMMVATTSVLAADADAHVYPCFRVPSDWRLVDLWTFNDAITGGTDYDFGIYQSGDWNSADQAVVDKDIYVDGASFATARVFGVSVDPSLAARSNSDAVASLGSAKNMLGTISGGGALTGIQRFRAIWQDAALSAAPVPGTTYDLAWTANTVGTGAGTIITVGFFAANS